MTMYDLNGKPLCEDCLRLRRELETYRDYVGSNMLHSDYRTVDEMRYALESTQAALRDTIADARANHEELEQIKEAHRRIMDEQCTADERHCTCVPALQMRCEKLESIINTIEDRHHPDSEWCAEAKEALK